ncbi:hypothetical protein [Bacillus sp. E(2018)]|uniref:hypothetical protein n=1 Tax=Bacillus sp. E(2018) TaxID=2502239 RepID=UPI0010F4A464|nr:hypothetical protein [Bacillus sp. E(2018)]
MAENLNPLFLSNESKETQFYHACNFIMAILNSVFKNFTIYGVPFEAFKPLKKPFTLFDFSLTGHSKGGGLVQKLIYYFSTVLNLHFSNDSTTFCAPQLLVTSINTKKGDFIPFNQFKEGIITLPLTSYPLRNYEIYNDRVIRGLSSLYRVYVKYLLIRKAISAKQKSKLPSIIQTRVVTDYIGENIVVHSKVKSFKRHGIINMFTNHFDSNGNYISFEESIGD